MTIPIALALTDHGIMRSPDDLLGKRGARTADPVGRIGHSQGGQTSGEAPPALRMSLTASSGFPATAGRQRNHP